ncbi:17-beta-hydroxysteroid dehydrogenase 14-like [Mercenaria mercenaria]|uniref:17-beta-hydroxysteroid dehydrogenase 14-like n=1 Tax=Mercenaria mercenaria TaxID=6596 RepID=UPI00234EBEF0|nr:17-beta-hydroxysteroid dehydrogenase 14-like [Mercenaria mercenaria]
MSKYALPYLRKSKGCIVNISSTAANSAAKNVSTYCATKGGVKALTKALAIDEAKHGVRVNSLAPGAVDTVYLREKVPAEQREYLEKCHTLGRLAQPREIG